MEYEVVETRNIPGEWRVEAIDYGSEGECYLTIFSGPKSHQRAEEYAIRESANDAIRRRAVLREELGR